MPNKDAPFQEAKISQADANYMDNEESGSFFRSQFAERLNVNLNSMKDVYQDPIVMKEWVIGQLGDQGMIADLQAGESASSTLNNIVAFSQHTKDANPRSYSDRIVENKLYQIYIHQRNIKYIQETNQETNQERMIQVDALMNTLKHFGDKI